MTIKPMTVPIMPHKTDCLIVSLTLLVQRCTFFDLGTRQIIHWSQLNGRIKNWLKIFYFKCPQTAFKNFSRKLLFKWKNFWKDCPVFKMFELYYFKWAIPLILFLSFQYNWQWTNVQHKFFRWLDSNRRPLVSEATALPTAFLKIVRFILLEMCLASRAFHLTDF